MNTEKNIKNDDNLKEDRFLNENKNFDDDFLNGNEILEIKEEESTKDVPKKMKYAKIKIWRNMKLEIDKLVILGCIEFPITSTGAVIWYLKCSILAKLLKTIASSTKNVAIQNVKFHYAPCKKWITNADGNYEEEKLKNKNGYWLESILFAFPYKGDCETKETIDTIVRILQSNLLFTNLIEQYKALGLEKLLNTMKLQGMQTLEDKLRKAEIEYVIGAVGEVVVEKDVKEFGSSLGIDFDYQINKETYLNSTRYAEKEM